MKQINYKAINDGLILALFYHIQPQLPGDNQIY